jgi:hypothetical protein
MREAREWRDERERWDWRDVEDDLSGRSRLSRLSCWSDRKPHQKNQSNQIDQMNQTDEPVRVLRAKRAHGRSPFHPSEAARCENMGIVPATLSSLFQHPAIARRRSPCSGWAVWRGSISPKSDGRWRRKRRRCRGPRRPTCRTSETRGMVSLACGVRP